MTYLKSLILFVLFAASIDAPIPGILNNAQGAIFERMDDIIEEVIPKTEFTNTQMEALRRELKLQRLFIEGIKGIEFKGGKIANTKRATRTIEDLIISSFRAKSSSLPNHIAEKVTDTVKGALKPKEIQSALVKLNEFGKEQINHKKIQLSSYARRFGIEAGLVYLLTMQIDVTFPTVMMAMGQMQFAPLLIAPVSSLATGTYIAGKNAVRLNQLIKSFGGLKNSLNHLQVFKQVKEHFNTSIWPHHDIVDISIAGKSYALTLEKQNAWTRFKQRLGWNKSLNYTNLKNFMNEHGLVSPAIERIFNSNSPQEVKLLRILHKFELGGTENLAVALKEQFGSFVNDMEGVPDFSQSRKWAAQISNSKSLDEFSRLMMNIPDDTPPGVLDKIWRNHIFAQASLHIGPFMDKETYKAFRKMDEYWEKNLRMEMSQSVDHSLNEHWKEKLAKFFFESLPSANTCGAIFSQRGDHLPLL